MTDGERDSDNLPVPAVDLTPLLQEPGGTLSQLERDYLMVALFVRVQHLRYEEALILIRALTAAGEVTPDVLFARAVVENATGDHQAALTTVRELERMAPAVIGAKSKITRRARMRAYIKARANFALTGELDEEGRAALDFYLRHGRKTEKRRKS